MSESSQIRGRSALQELIHAAWRVAGANHTKAAGTRLFDYIGCVLGAGTADGWPGDRSGRLSVAAHQLDLDDLHLRTLTHPGGIVWSAVIASADATTTLRDAYQAAALGYEIAVRLAETMSSEVRTRWHATTCAGTAGAAAAATYLLSRDSDRVQGAVAHAVSLAGGSTHAVTSRSKTRFVLRAHAATSGLMCARAACEGLAGSSDELEASPIFDASKLPMSALRDAEPCAIAESGFRLYFASGHAHAAIDASLAIDAIEPHTIERVTVAVPALVVALASNNRPATDEEAWWSVEHAVAVVLATHDPDELRRGVDVGADVSELRERIDLQEGADGPASARLDVARVDGTTLEASVSEPTGHAERPATDDQLCAKWEALTGRDGRRLLSALTSASDAALLATLSEHGAADLLFDSP